MNPESIAAFTVPMFVFGIPLAWVIFNGWQKVVRLRIEEAKARSGIEGTDHAAVEGLRADVDQLRNELSEVHERLDFAERLLATGRDREKLPRASE